MDVAPETRREATRTEPAPGPAAASAAGLEAPGTQSGSAPTRTQVPPPEGGGEQAVPAAEAGPVADPRRWWVLAACCTAACARLVDPKLWMMGLDIPDTAFGAGWQHYRLFSTVTVLLLLAGMLFGGLAGRLLRPAAGAAAGHGGVHASPAS